MNSSKLLTGAVVSLAICAVALTVRNVQQAYFPLATDLTAPVDSVAEWRLYEVGATRVGPDNAKVTVIVFSDYQCPVCRGLASILVYWRAKYEDELGVVWRHFPLEGHLHAVEAARAAICSDEQGRFEQYHHALFGGQDSLATANWTQYASLVGVADTVAFDDCLHSARSMDALVRDQAAGRQLRVVATPTILINGMEYVGVPRDFAKILRRELRSR